MTLSRRNLLLGATFMAPMFLIACTTVNGVTTVTVPVAKAVAFAAGAAAVVSSLMAFPGVQNALGAAVPAIETAIADVDKVGPAVQAVAR